jgi:SulP family sulfate permease
LPDCRSSTWICSPSCRPAPWPSARWADPDRGYRPLDQRLTRQKLDNNQEFTGQGLANIAAGLLSGYPVSASFSRSVFNLQAGARTPLAAVSSGIFLIVALLTLAPLAAHIPLAAVSGVLILTSINLIDRNAIARIWRGSREESLIMLVTLLGTLFLRLDFAVLTGILLSFAIYIKNTSVPRVLPVVPDENFRHLSHQPGRPLCPQLAIFDILGDLHFGAVNHVEDSIRRTWRSTLRRNTCSCACST